MKVYEWNRNVKIAITVVLLLPFSFLLLLEATSYFNVKKIKAAQQIQKGTPRHKVTKALGQPEEETFVTQVDTLTQDTILLKRMHFDVTTLEFLGEDMSICLDKNDKVERVYLPKGWVWNAASNSSPNNL